MQFNIDVNFFEGDLCQVKGYGHLVWEVIGFAPTFERYRGKLIDEYVTYTFQNVHTGEEILAFEEDLSLICRAKFAFDYIRQLDKNSSPPDLSVNSIRKGRDKVEADKSALAPYKYSNTVDGLLEELSDLLAIIDFIGEDEYLKHRVNDVKLRLETMKN